MEAVMNYPVYLDNNATTPVDARVLDAMLPYFTHQFGNAASNAHIYGWEARDAVDQAREETAALIGAETKEIVFTSGATESDNLAIKGIFDRYRTKGNHIITCVTEHKAVLDTCHHLENTGAEVTYLPVDHNGRIDPGQLELAIKPSTVLIAIMYANNETGTVQPVKEISVIAKKHGLIFFSDATQAVGKIPVNVQEGGIDVMAFSAHKMYGPKGVGGLYVRRKSPAVKLTAQMDGGGHEKGMRSGTLNVPGIVGLGKACAICQEEMTVEAERLSRLRDALEKELLGIPDTYLNGYPKNRTPNVTNIAFGFVEGESLKIGFHKHIAVSSGSACSSASMEPSHVLKAMGLGDLLAQSSFRFSLGRFTTEEDIHYAARHVRETVTKLREMSGVWKMYTEGKYEDISGWRRQPEIS
jgi:cysteine desulfurase